MARAGFHQNQSGVEIAEILRRHGQDFARVHAAHLGRVERRVMSAITACRTATLGGQWRPRRKHRIAPRHARQ